MRRIARRRHAAVVAAVLAALWLVAAGVSAARAQERVGAVAEVEGQAEALHTGASAWSPLAAGDPILLGDQLRTGSDAKLRVVLREDSVLTLAPGSQLAVTEQLVAPAAVSRFQLLLGTIKAAVTDRYSELNSRFEVETPTAIAGVRGTTFLAAWDPTQEETLVVGLSSVTRVRALVDPQGLAEVDLGPGVATRVRRGSRPLAPARLPEDRLRSLQGATTLGAGAGAGSGRRANRLDARRPRRPGERAMSTEEQAVDQPLFTPRTPKPPPPPPPVPGGRR